MSMSVSIDKRKHFITKIGEKHSFKKKSNSQNESPESPETTINEVMESITINKNYSATQELTSNETDDNDLIKLFDQFSGFTSPMSDCLELDTTTVISKASLQGRSVTHQDII